MSFWVARTAAEREADRARVRAGDEARRVISERRRSERQARIRHEQEIESEQRMEAIARRMEVAVQDLEGVEVKKGVEGYRGFKRELVMSVEQKQAREELGIALDQMNLSRRIVNAFYQDRAAWVHPDQNPGIDASAFQRLVSARDLLLEQVGLPN